MHHACLTKGGELDVVCVHAMNAWPTLVQKLREYKGQKRYMFEINRPGIREVENYGLLVTSPV